MRWWRPVLLLAVALGLAAVAVEIGVPPLEVIRGWVAAAGWAGPVLYAALYAGLSLTPVPASVLSVGGGVLFGLGLGLPVVMVGAVLGAAAGFALARRLGRGSVERLQERAGYGAARLTRLDDLLRRRGLLAMTTIRLAPILPFAVLNMACGLTSVRTRDYVVGSAIGMTPGAAALVAIGTYGADPGSLPFLISVAGLVLVIVIGAVLARRRHDGAACRTMPHAVLVGGPCDGHTEPVELRDDGPPARLLPCYRDTTIYAEDTGHMPVRIPEPADRRRGPDPADATGDRWIYEPDLDDPLA
jgi:uncharacterized membrane protein YdjX (TVP38/TMEM64 family)